LSPNIKEPAWHGIGSAGSVYANGKQLPGLSFSKQFLFSLKLLIIVFLLAKIEKKLP